MKNLRRSSPVWISVGLGLWLGGCEQASTPERSPVAVTEIDFPGYTAGFMTEGSVQTISLPAGEDAASYEAGTTHEARWYSFVASEAGYVTFTIESNDGNSDYNFMLYEGDEQFAEKIADQPVEPLRANLSPIADEGQTGLRCAADGEILPENFSAAVEAEAGQRFYLMVDLKGSENHGYTLRLGGCDQAPPRLTQWEEEPAAEYETTVYETQPDGEHSYIVKTKNTASSIARAFNMSVQEFMDLNNLNSPDIDVGQQVYVKQESPDNAALIKPRPFGEAGSQLITIDTDAESTLYSIAQQYGMSVEDIIQLNELSSYRLVPGEPLQVYAQSGTTAARPAEAPSEFDLAQTTKEEAEATAEVTETAAAPATPAATAPASETEPAYAANEPTQTSAPEEVAGASEESAPPAEAPEQTLPSNAVASISEEPLEKPAAEASAPDTTAATKNFAAGEHYVYLDVRGGRLSQPVKTFVDIVSEENGRTIRRIRAHEAQPILIRDTDGKSLIFKVEKFGFRKAEYVVDMANPRRHTAEVVAAVDDTLYVSYELSRYKKNDIAVMYNVYFYDDAAIMKRRSLPELTSLLEFMQEDTAAHIRIHGHTNGNGAGKIVTMSEDDGNFFALSKSNKTTRGSAKALSKERAAVIGSYLISKGISPDRIETQGWGGKRPIFDKRSHLADQNKRVEIEVIESS